MKKLSKLKAMLLAICTATIFALGYFLRDLLEKQVERRAIRKHYNRRRRIFDENNKLTDDRIDGAPIEELLKPGEYLKD